MRYGLFKSSFYNLNLALSSFNSCARTARLRLAEAISCIAADCSSVAVSYTHLASTNAIATTGPDTSSIASFVASFGDKPL